MTPALAYLRVSGNGQIARDVAQLQRDAIRRFASVRNIHIAKWFEERDAGEAAEWQHRPAWSDMFVSMDGARIIVVDRLERLARDLLIQEHILRDLNKRGVSLFSVAEPDTDSDPARVLIRHVMTGITHYDRTMRLMKLRAARELIRESTGRCEGRKPYGDHPGEVETLQRMLAMRECGSTYEQIADALNAGGMRPRRADKWCAASVNKIIRRSAA